MRLPQKAVCIIVLMFAFVSAGICEELRMLVWEGYAPAEQVSQFKKYVKETYGTEIDIHVTNVSAVEDFHKALKKKTADIISPAHNLPKDPRFKFISGKLTLPINLENVPNYTKMIPDLQRAAYITKNNEVYGVPLTYGPYGLAYNTRHFEKAPDTWNVFWDPKYAGKYTISSDYYEANIYSTALAMGMKKSEISKYDTVNTPELMEKLGYLAKNAKSMWEGVDSADGLQGLSLATAWGFALPELKKRGEIWKMAVPREGTTGWVDNLMLGSRLRSKPELKKIAEAWLNFCLTKEFQAEVVVRAIGCYPVVPETKEMLKPDEIESYHLDDPDYFKNNLILWKVLDNRTRKGFQLMWKKATK